VVLALAVLLIGCGAVDTSQPDGETAVPTTVALQATLASTPTRLVVPPTSTQAAPAREMLAAEPTPTATEAALDLPGPVQITIVYDNTVARSGLAAEWGFAAWVEIGGQQILFDTGPDGPALLSNLAQLGLDPEEIDLIVLSHEHGDHTGGLASLLATGIHPPVYAPRGVPESLKASIRARTELIEVLDPVEVLPGVYSTGQLGGGPVEQALVLESPAGLVVLTGCAHPGILRIVRQATALVEDEVALVLGGFHLADTPPETVDSIVTTFRQLDVKQVAPTHCTGEAAIQAFSREYGQDCLAGGAGRIIAIGLGEEPGALPAPDPTASLVPTGEPTLSPTPEPTASAEPAGKYQKPGNYIDTVRVNGISRWFSVHLPPGYRPGVPAPLVLNLHAFGSTAFQQEALTEMHAKADEVGFVAVHPQALNDPPAWYGPLPSEAGQNDRLFFEALLSYLPEVISIDPDRIYATGMSNGGTMTYRLGCDMAGTFAAIAPVAGGHLNHQLCEPESPISVLVIHGTDDQVIPYEGQGRDQPSVHVWLEAWAEHNLCDSVPVESHPYQSVRAETWTHCDGGVEVVLYTLEGGGHTWPGAPQGLSVGTSFPYMSATDVIWEFFASHPRSLQERAVAAGRD
jgi:7,8-dihydropterin-6-yl-methyl-4-(beta-D-ribofuranosyl)aminobenzene 5'-phosphate synthase